LLLFAQAPVDGTFVANVLPGMVLAGFGGGIAFNPLLLAAMSDVDTKDAGLASGVVNTAFMMGGALGLAVLASLAAARSASLGRTLDATAAVAGGFQLTFLVGAAFAAIAALLGAILIRSHPNQHAAAGGTRTRADNAVAPGN
jgi:MFS family permease